MPAATTGQVKGERGEPTGFVTVAYLGLSAVGSIFLAVRLTEFIPAISAERWFFFFFWILFGVGLLLGARKMGAVRSALPAAAMFGGSAFLCLIVGWWGMLAPSVGAPFLARLWRRRNG